MNFTKFFCFLTPCVLLMACSSAPPSVEASRNMIETVVPSKNKKVVPQELWSELNTRYVGDSFQYQDVAIVFGEFYYSALGQYCRTVSLNRSTELYGVPQQRAVCKKVDSEQWSIAPNVVDSKKELISLGAK